MPDSNIDQGPCCHLMELSHDLLNCEWLKDKYSYAYALDIWSHL